MKTIIGLGGKKTQPNKIKKPKKIKHSNKAKSIKKKQTPQNETENIVI